MGREVDRTAWAKFIRDELLPTTKGKKATLARLLGVDPTTLGNWLRCDVAVSEASVRQVAERTGRNAMDLLIRVGYYSPDEIPVRLTDEQIDEEQRAVLDHPDLSDEQRVAILKELEEMRTVDQQLLDAQAQRDRQRRETRISERIALLLGQAHRSR